MPPSPVPRAGPRVSKSPAGTACVGNGARGEPWTELLDCLPRNKPAHAFPILVSGVAMTLVQQQPGRVVATLDGGAIFLTVGQGRSRSRAAHRPRHKRQSVLFGWITATQKDWALAGVCALLVFGAIAFAFGLASFTFGVAQSLSWTFWLTGLGTWALALGIFFSFMTNPYPKHSADR